MKKSHTPSFYIGVVMALVGAVLFFSRVRVGSYLFPRFGSFDSAPLFLVGWAVCFLLLVLRPGNQTKILLALMTFALVITIILSAHIYFIQTPMIMFFFILALLFGGAGLILRELLGKTEKKK